MSEPHNNKLTFHEYKITDDKFTDFLLSHYFFLRSKHISHFLDSMHKLQSKKKLAMLTELRSTPSEFHNLTIQVQNTELTSIDTQYPDFSNISHDNLKHSLTIMSDNLYQLSNSTSALLEF